MAAARDLTQLMNEKFDQLVKGLAAGKLRQRLQALPPIPPLSPRGTTIARDLSSGLITAIVTIAYCVSFSALLFQGNVAGRVRTRPLRVADGLGDHRVHHRGVTTLPPAGAGPGYAGDGRHERARGHCPAGARRQAQRLVLPRNT